jgi:glycosyltransferase involved in cell wall biosynthesis
LGLEREHFVLSVGSLTPLKGFDFLVETLALLPSAERPRLVIVSNFQNHLERDYMTGLAKMRGVELELLDQISDERLVELYNRAALTAYAPHREPFGFVSLEAMACASPLAVVAEGGIREAVLPGKTALAAPRDTGAFAEIICTLLTDRKMAAELGQAGRQHVLERWTWEHSVKSLEQNLIF